MGIQINGRHVTIGEIAIVVGFIVWLSGLSFQANSNAQELEKRTEKIEEVNTLKTTQDIIKDDVEEVKEDVKELQKVVATNNAILGEILREIRKGDAE